MKIYQLGFFGIWISLFLWGSWAVAELRVMTYNIRFGTAKDGENHWDRRKELLVETIQAFSPDLLGTQETLVSQKGYLEERLKDYESHGVGRDDGKKRGEMAALFFRRDRFEKQDSGHFWLSKKPDQAGSKSWDAALPRMVSWVKLVDRNDSTQPPILFANTHFDHVGQVARRESAALLIEKLEDLGQGCRIVLTGDFNCSPWSPPYDTLFRPSEDQSLLVDAYRRAHPDTTIEEGTFCNFFANQTRGDRIDWIGISRGWKTKAAEIVHTARNGRTPSDHFPVTAILE